MSRARKFVERFGADRLAVAAILVVALALRVGAIAATQGYAPTWDAADYNAHAVRLAEHGTYPTTFLAGVKRVSAPDPGQPPTVQRRGRGASAFRPPVWPYALAAIYAVKGQSWTGGRLLQAVLGAVAVLLVYLVALGVWDRRIALVAAGVAAVAPSLVFLNVSLMSEPVFLVIELSMVLALLAYGRSGGRLRWAALAGVLAGLGTLTRANGVVLVAAAAVGVLMLAPRPWRRRLGATALLFLVTALTIAPWTIRNAVVFGQFVPVSTQAGLGLAGSYSPEARQRGLELGWLHPLNVDRFYLRYYSRPDLDEVQVDRRVRGEAVSFALHHPGYVAETTALNSLRMLELYDLGRYREVFQQERGLTNLELRALVRIGGYVLAAVALLGAVVLFLRPPLAGRGPLFLWLIPVLIFVSTVPINGSPRYRAPIDPFLALLAAVALARAWEWLREARAARTRPAGHGHPATEGAG